MAAIRGIVKRVLKDGDGPQDRSFAVVSYEKDDGTLSEVRLGGRMGGLGEGDCFSAEGQWRTSEYRGKTQHIFNARSIRPDFPKTRNGVVSWLKAILPAEKTGLGPADIEAAIDSHDDAEQVVRTPDNLIAKSSDPEEHGDVIRRIVEFRSSAKRATDMMQSAKLDTPSINRILSAFKNETYQTLQRNPYDIMVVPSVDFDKADRLGNHMGVSGKDHRRVVAAGWDYIHKAASLGASCAPVEDIITNVSERFSLERDYVNQIILEKISSRDADKFHALQIPGTSTVYVMSESSYRNEISAASSLLNVLERNRRNDPDLVAAAAQKILADTRLDEHQKKAVEVGVTHPISVITGGPGTGKSTILEKLIEVSKQVEDCEVIVTAPTGKAAKRAEEVTGEQGQTLQMLLGQHYDEKRGRNAFRVNRDNPIPENTVVVVDEVSMMDNELLAALFSAMPQSGRIVLQGDKNQLPSVGIGRVLADLMEVNIDGQNVVPTAELVNVYRQDEDSLISKVADSIKDGVVPELSESLRGGVMFKECSSREITSQILNMVRHQFVAKGIDPAQDVAIIAPQAPGFGGTWEINAALSKELNPDGEAIPGVVRGKYDDERMPLPRVGDRIMLTDNDHENNVMNGDVGFIRGFKPNEKNPNASIMTIEYDDGREVDMPSQKWRDLMLSYAITCHKSQGSQYPIVVMPFSEMHERMADRSLVYTGWTRAKKMVVGIGSKDTFEKFVKTDKASKRFTILRPMFEHLAGRRKVRCLGAVAEPVPLQKPPKIPSGRATPKMPVKPAQTSRPVSRPKVNLGKKVKSSQPAPDVEAAPTTRKRVSLAKGLAKRKVDTTREVNPAPKDEGRGDTPVAPKPAGRKVRPLAGRIRKKPRVNEEEAVEEPQPSMKL
ncbi:AAA family ATPase [Salipiger mucosus]|uniref:RecD-like DNA helicase YrrC n=1 Tax=Salipiger mucosus DSM 16094 TaxID=1123237 RepID=S9QRH7_9RHOB|nr:AAA family ATPase [Salipiger mucosus]EPX83996.1 RecD-like DNA helicase YrrC [Salipiger mucosus DSM 16094]